MQIYLNKRRKCKNNNIKIEMKPRLGIRGGMGKSTKIKTSLQGSTTNANVEALGKKSNLFSNCKLM
jgi:hypothetical protein